MKSNILSISAVIVMILAACSGNDDVNPPTKTDMATFLKNTEWVGTLDGNGFEYPPPVSIKFYSGNTFSMHSIFVFFPNGVAEYRDSISGTITSIDSLPDGRSRINTNINTNFRPSATTAIYITDRKQIMGISSNPNDAPTFQAVLFPSAGISVAGEWSGSARDVSGVNYNYPDLSTISFDAADGHPVTYYTRHGSPVVYPDQTHWRTLYVQRGARLYMSGYNETMNGGIEVPYFGVLLPSGDKMMVHSINDAARLPNYVNTSEPYGPNGATPVISRK
ncbi:MAG: hypothetical protein ABIS36_12370 [Chryseolinea sp.]